MSDEAAPAGFSRHLALLGTASDVGKSVLTSAMCRLLSDAGYNVAPYKAQNMSNNAAVAHDGGEIGRAQYVQARAARVPASVHHNPVLLKPMSESRCQVVVRGQVPYTIDAVAYYSNTAKLREIAFQSLRLLCAEKDIVVIEGAGSCAEVNLRSRDFVNFEAAHEANARVVLVADIERGGVFAQLVGSLEVMPPADRARVCGIIVNKFRGEKSLFDEGVRYLEQRTDLPVLGVVPHLSVLDIDEEDSVGVTRRLNKPRVRDASTPRIAVIAYPHLANYTDFDALELEDVRVEFIAAECSLSGYHAVILPGSKAVAKDLAWLRMTGLAREVERFHAAGGKILGVCGGLQMLGQRIEDPHGVELLPNALSEPLATPGLGLLALTTTFAQTKTVRQCCGVSVNGRHAVSGYELHHGQSSHDYQPLFTLKSMSPGADANNSNAEFADGVRTDSDTIWGTYLHGLFDEPEFRHAFVRWVLPTYRGSLNAARRADVLDQAIDRFAAHVRSHINWSTVRQWIL